MSRLALAALLWLSTVTAQDLFLLTGKANTRIAPPTPVPPPSPAPTPSACTSDIDCSLNGACIAQSCICDKPWSGAACERMNFKPVAFPQGYGMQPNLTTWGGNVIHDEATGKYHMYVSAIDKNCPLHYWMSQSRIDHGVADSVTGPYVLKDVAVPVRSHNAAPIKLKDGTYAIVHIFNGTQKNPVHDCITGANIPPPKDPPPGSSVHVSKSLDGPWEPLLPDTFPTKNCRNPAPWVHQNGTIFLMCDDGMHRSEDIRGPWLFVSKVRYHNRPPWGLEDAFLYNTARGWHLLYHASDRSALPTPHVEDCINSTVAAHSFSKDGFTWQISHVPPFTTQVKLATGETMTVATRERPKLFFNAQGEMTHLVNGVASRCDNPMSSGFKPCLDCKYANWDYTLIQPLAI